MFPYRLEYTQDLWRFGAFEGFFSIWYNDNPLLWDRGLIIVYPYQQLTEDLVESYCQKNKWILLLTKILNLTLMHMLGNNAKYAEYADYGEYAEYAKYTAVNAWVPSAFCNVFYIISASFSWAIRHFFVMVKTISRHRLKM